MSSDGEQTTYQDISASMHQEVRAMGGRPLAARTHYVTRQAADKPAVQQEDAVTVTLRQMQESIGIRPRPSTPDDAA